MIRQEADFAPACRNACIRLHRNLKAGLALRGTTTVDARWLSGTVSNKIVAMHMADTIQDERKKL